MPLVILGVRRAEPAVTLVAEDFGGLVARFVEAGNTFTRRLHVYVWILAGPLCFHDCTRGAILLLSGQCGNRSAARTVLADGFVDQRVQLTAGEPHMVAGFVRIGSDREFRASTRRWRDEIAGARGHQLGHFATRE